MLLVPLASLLEGLVDVSQIYIDAYATVSAHSHNGTPVITIDGKIICVLDPNLLEKTEENHIEVPDAFQKEFEDSDIDKL